MRKAIEAAFFYTPQKQSKHLANLIDFNQFYKLIDAVLRDRSLQWSAIFKIYGNVVNDLLKANVAIKLADINSAPTLQSFVEVLATIFDKLSSTLESKYLGTALAYVEKRISLDSRANETMLFNEMVCHLYLTRVMYHPQMLSHLQATRFAYINMARDELKARLLSSHDGRQLMKLNADEQMLLVNTNRLLVLLTKLDERHHSIRKALFEMPLIDESKAYCFGVVDELVERLEPVDYIGFVVNFMEVNRAMLMNLKPLSTELIDIYTTCLGHFLLITAWPRIRDRLNLSRLLANNSKVDNVGMVACIFKTVVKISHMIHEKRLLSMLIELVQEYLTELLQEMKRFSLQTRLNMLEFVAKVFELKYRLDDYLISIFGMNTTISSMFFNFFVQVLQFNPRSSQALALGITDLMYSERSLLFNTMSQLMLSKKLPNGLVLENTAQARLALAENFYSLIVYIKDHGDFIEYLKHYYCNQLLNTQKQTCLPPIVPKEDVLMFLSQMMTRINEVVNHKDMPGLTPYTYLTENLRIFKFLEQDYNESHKGFQDTRTAFRQLAKKWKLPKEAGSTLKLANIIHGTLWKASDFEQCLLPNSMAKSWRTFVEAFNLKRRGENVVQKRLALNTKYSVVTVETQFRKSPSMELTLSVNQMAVLECFNACDRLKYDQLVNATRFKSEVNLQLAILSLVLANLVNFVGKGDPTNSSSPSSLSTDNLVLTYNDNFYQDNIAHLSKKRPIKEVNLAHLEDADFCQLSANNLTDNFLLSFNGQNYLKCPLSNKNIVERVHTLLACFNWTDDTGLQRSTMTVDNRQGIFKTIMENSIKAEQNAARSLKDEDFISLQRSTRNMTEASSGVVSSPTLSDGTGRSQNRRKACKRKRKATTTSRTDEEDVTAGRVSSTTEEVVENAIELEHKLECALMRLLKSERFLPNVKTVQRKLLKSIKANPKANISPPELERITLDEIRRILNGLVQRGFLNVVNVGYSYVI